MTAWTTSDMLADLDRRGFEVKGWSPKLSPITVIQLQFALLAMAYQTAFVTAAACKRNPVEQAHHVRKAMQAIAKIDELVDLWRTLWPDVRG